MTVEWNITLVTLHQALKTNYLRVFVFVVYITVLMDMLIQQVGINMEMFFGTLLILFMIFMAYVGTVVSEEQRQGKHIPLIWEKEFWK
jgi:hypothetical protein